MFYNIRATHLPLNESERLVKEEDLVFFCKKTRIPIQESHRTAKRLTNLYKEWRSLLLYKRKTEITTFIKTGENGMMH